MGTRVKKNKLWTEDLEVVLVEFYAKQPCLWQNKNQKGEKEKRAGLLEVLRSQLNNCFTVNEIVSRFTSMRTTYFANKKRMKEAAKNGKVFKSKWAHFESFSFLSKTQDNDSEDVNSINTYQDGEVMTDDLSAKNSEDSEPEIICTQNGLSQDATLEIPVAKSNEWSISEEESLISFYESHRDLWDHRTKDYKKSQKGQIMDDLAAHLELKFSRKQIIDKFASMKAKFFRELKKVEETSASGAGLEEMYESEYIHFDQLQFLRICRVVDKTTSFMDLGSDDEYFNNKENCDNDRTAMHTESSPDSSNDSTNIQSTPLQSFPRNIMNESPMPSTSQGLQNRTGGIKRALNYTPLPPKRPVKKPEPKSNADSLINAALATLSSIDKNEVKPVDECQMTGSFVAFTLSTLDKDTRVGAIAHFIEYCLSLKK